MDWADELKGLNLVFENGTSEKIIELIKLEGSHHYKVNNKYVINYNFFSDHLNNNPPLTDIVINNNQLEIFKMYYNQHFNMDKQFEIELKEKLLNKFLEIKDLLTETTKTDYYQNLLKTPRNEVKVHNEMPITYITYAMFHNESLKNNHNFNVYPECELFARLLNDLVKDAYETPVKEGK